MYLFQGMNGVLSDMRTDMRRFTITAIIVVVITVKLLKQKKKKQLTGRNHVGIVSHRIPSKKPPVK